MKIMSAILALVALLALAHVGASFKIWKKVCKPVANSEHLLFSGVSCQMVLVDPFEPLINFLNQPVRLYKTTSVTYSSRRRGHSSPSATTSSSWGGFGAETTPAPEPTEADQPAETPSSYTAEPIMESSTPAIETSTPASSGFDDASPVVSDPIQSTTSKPSDATSSPTIFSSDATSGPTISSSDAPIEGASSSQSTETPLATEATRVVTEESVQLAESPSTSAAPVEDASLVGRSESVDQASALDGVQSTTEPVQPAVELSSATTTAPAVQSSTLEPLQTGEASSANPILIDTQASTQSVAAPVDSEPTPADTTQPEELPSSTSAAPIVNLETQPSSAEQVVTEAATSAHTYAPTLAEVIVSASSESPATAAVPDESSPSEPAQKDSPVVETTASPSEPAPTERMQTLVVSSATTSSPTEPTLEAAPSPAPLSHDPTTSEAPTLVASTTTTEKPRSDKQFIEAMEPN